MITRNQAWNHTAQRTIGVALATVAVVSLSSCAGESGSGGDGDEVNLAMELTLTGVKFAQDTRAGMEAFADEDGNVNLDVQGPPSIDPALAQQQTNNLLTRNPDGFGVSPFPPSLWTRTLQDLTQRVPNSLAYAIKPVETQDEAASSLLKTFVGINDAAHAREAMTTVIELGGLDTDTTGDVILGQCVPGDTGVLAERVDAWRDVASELLPNTNVEVFDSKVEPQANTAAWDQQLRAHPDTVLAIGACDQDGPSIYKVKKEQGYDFAAGALETSPETLTGVEDGTLLATSAVNWYLQGYTVARLLTEGARGDALPEGFVDIGATLITSDNVAEIIKRDSSPEETAAWYAPKIEELFADLDANTYPLEEAW